MKAGYRTILITLALAALAATHVSAQGRYVPRRGHRGATQAVRVEIGQFTPDGDSRYWMDKEFDFFGTADDFQDTGLAVDYLRFLGPRLGLLVSGSFYNAEKRQSYRDFVLDGGGEIEHNTQLDTSSFTAGLLLHLTRRSAPVVPYVGAGGGFYLYRLSEDGDFIDFDNDLEVFNARFETEGETFGWYYQAGLEVPVSNRWSVIGDARWQHAEDELSDDFDGLGKLDLGGLWITLGASVSF